MVAVLAVLAARAAAAPHAGDGLLDDHAGAPLADEDPHALESEDLAHGGPDSAPVRELEPGHAAGSASAVEPAGVWPGHERPSRWGRLELAVVWRRSLDDAAAGEASRRGELWLLATWSR